MKAKLFSFMSTTFASSYSLCNHRLLLMHNFFFFFNFTFLSNFSLSFEITVNGYTQHKHNLLDTLAFKLVVLGIRLALIKKKHFFFTSNSITNDRVDIQYEYDVLFIYYSFINRFK